MSDLESIKARALDVAEWRKHFHAPQNKIDLSQQDVPRLVAALEAVLELADADRFIHQNSIRKAIESSLASDG